ncbi:hypothetical protein AWB68_08854 [Caballeronia choica]|uniref:Uncharacterized protein n=1 Tax=Caballeronia choica TaxID=326476 RepID=A0A158L738_9BURK|nr:hypothetical protein AWB68_08854 [Caballeronia choica]
MANQTASDSALVGEFVMMRAPKPYRRFKNSPFMRSFNCLANGSRCSA